MKKRRPLLLVAALLMAALAPTVARASTTSTLEALGGTACTADSEFTCVKLSVPLNHFDPTDTRRIKVAFAVRPANKTSHGLFVVATGGPGTSGILSADSYLSRYSQKMLDRYDIVFFDQGGRMDTGLSVHAWTSVRRHQRPSRSDRRAASTKRTEASASSSPILGSAAPRITSAKCAS